MEKAPQNPYGNVLSAKLDEILHRGRFPHADQKYLRAQSSERCSFKVKQGLSYKNTNGLKWV